jgi:hypothetical protein
MGVCASVFTCTPNIVSSFTSAECQTIINTAVDVNPNSAPIPVLVHPQYTNIFDDELKSFQNSYDIQTNREFRIPTYCCDENAQEFLGAAKYWYGKISKNPGGWAIGLLTGDLRLKATDPLRAHCVVCYINENKKFTIYDPTIHTYYDLQPWMVVWNIWM